MFIGISDVHISLKNLKVSIEVLTQALDESRVNQCPLVIGGDLNDTKAVLRSEYIKALIELFKEYHDVKVIILIGNHDLNNKMSEAHSLEFLRALDNITLVDKAIVLDMGNTNVGFIPYHHTKESFREALSSLKFVDYLVCHQGFQGALMGDYVVDDSSINPSEMNSYKKVVTGHYHKSQSLENILYFGSPFTVNFGESKDAKYIWKIDFAKDYYEPIPTKVRRHHQLVFKNIIPKEVGINKITEDDMLKVVLKGTKEFCLKTKESEIKKLTGINNITIVPEIIKQSENRIDAEILHSPIKVIDQYLDKCNTDFDKKLLREFFFRMNSDILNSISTSLSKSYRIKSVEAENILSYQTMKYQYDATGLTLIEGFDEDYNISTGAGKSSFLDIPCWILYGKTSKDIKADEIINIKYNKNAFGQLTLENDAGELIIRRYRKHKEFDNDLLMILADGTEVRGKDNRETQTLIEKELGVSYNLFLRATYFGQFDDIDKFLSSSDTEKKKLASEIIDLSIYDQLVDNIKDNNKIAETNCESMEYKLDKTQSNIDLLKLHEDDVFNKSAKWEMEIKDSYVRLTKESKEFKETQLTKVTQIQTNISDFEELRVKQISEAQEKINTFESERQTKIDNVHTTINEKKANIKVERLEFSNKIIELENQKVTTQEKISKIFIDESKDFQGILEKINEKLNIIRTLEHKLISIGAEIQTEQGNLTRFSNDLSKEINSESNCSSCGQEIPKESKDFKIEQIQKSIQYSQEALLSLDAQKKEIESSILIKGELNQKIIDLNKEENEFNQKVNEVDYHKNQLVSLADQIKSLEGQMYSLKVDTSSYEQTIELYKNEANPFLKDLESIQNKVNPHKNLLEIETNKVNSFDIKLEELSKEVNPYTEMLKESKADISKYNQMHVQQKLDLVKLQVNVNFGLWWKDAVNVFIKSYLIDSFVDELNVRTNEYLSTLFDSILQIELSSTTQNKKEIKEKINLIIYYQNQERTYKSLSGGERCRICLATNLAISDIISHNSKKSFNFLMLDEIFTGLDESGKSQTMRLLKDLESKYESIFVIDHSTEFKSLFTNNIQVNKKDGVSSIV